MEDSKQSMESRVKAFQVKYGHFCSETPNHNVPQQVKQLRTELVMEEFNEFFTGLINNDLIEIADGAADLMYVVIGTCVAFGIPIERIFIEVHRSNMTKTAVKAENGEKYGTKTPKGPDYIAPDVIGILTNPHLPTVLEQRN